MSPSLSVLSKYRDLLPRKKTHEPKTADSFSYGFSISLRRQACLAKHKMLCVPVGCDLEFNRKCPLTVPLEQSQRTWHLCDMFRDESSIPALQHLKNVWNFKPIIH